VRIDQPNQAPGRVAGLVGTVVVHAGAVLFLVAGVQNVGLVAAEEESP